MYYLSLIILVLWSFNYNMFHIRAFRVNAIRCEDSRLLYLIDTPELVGVMWHYRTNGQCLQRLFFFFLEMDHRITWTIIGCFIFKYNVLLDVLISVCERCAKNKSTSVALLQLHFTGKVVHVDISIPKWCTISYKTCFISYICIT